MSWLCGEKKAQDTAPVSPELCVSVYMHVFRDLFSHMLFISQVYFNW